jgi:hypothetical protein
VSSNRYFALSVHQRLELCLIEFDRLLLFAVNPACDDDEHDLPRPQDKIHGSSSHPLLVPKTFSMQPKMTHVKT